MADEQRRARVRDAAHSGLDRLRLWSDALRASEHARAAAELAAYVGDPAARTALAEPPAGPAPTGEGPDAFYVGLARWGKAACDEAAVAILRCVAELKGLGPDVLEEHVELAARRPAWQSIQTSPIWSRNGFVSGRVMLVLANEEIEAAADEFVVAARYASALVGPIRVRLAVRCAVSDWALNVAPTGGVLASDPATQREREAARTFRLAFPQGIPRDEYLSLLCILHDRMSQRAVARTVSNNSSLDYIAVLHDVPLVEAGGFDRESAVVEALRTRLMRCGLGRWS